MVLPYLASREVAIGRGENAREKLTYTNIVREIVPIGRWTGAAAKASIPLKDYRDYDGITVLLQEGTQERPGAILGATRISLHSGA